MIFFSFWYLAHSSKQPIKHWITKLIWNSRQPMLIMSEIKLIYCYSDIGLYDITFPLTTIFISDLPRHWKYKTLNMLLVSDSMEEVPLLH